MSLRDMFFIKVRDMAYVSLKQGLMRDWNAEFVYRFVDEVIEEKISEINYYLQQSTVTLENMNYHADQIVRSIILPHISKKRIE
jgi:hypothetical protein